MSIAAVAVLERATAYLESFLGEDRHVDKLKWKWWVVKVKVVLVLGCEGGLIELVDGEWISCG